VKIRQIFFVSLVTVSLLFGSASVSAAAATYSNEENVAWALSLRNPNSKMWARGLGKSTTVAHMRTVCFNLDAGDSCEDIGDKGLLTAKKAEVTVGKTKAVSWLFYAGTISKIAVAQMCPRHSYQVPKS